MTAMMGFIRFIFGGGWWTLWHGLMLLILVVPNLAYFKEFLNWTLRKTGEPAAAMAVFATHFGFSGLPLILCSGVNGLLLIALARGSWLTRSLLVFNVVVILIAIYLFLSTAVAGRSFASLLASYGVSVLALGLNLWMLWCVRRRGLPDAPVIAGTGLTIGLAVLPILIGLFAGGVFAILKWDEASDRAAAAAGVGGRDRAAKLVRAYVSDHWHNTAPGLNDQNVWIGLYGIQITYDPTRDVLISQMDLHTWIQPEDFDLVVRGIHDPAIGGMYDHRQAAIEVNAVERTILMKREFKVGGLSAKTFSATMDDLWLAAQFWRDGYLQRMPAIYQGRMPAPEQPLTIEQEREAIRARSAK